MHVQSIFFSLPVDSFYLYPWCGSLSSKPFVQPTLLLYYHGAMSHPSQCSRTKNHAQTIEGEYLDPQKLILLLRAVYGTSEGMNNFRVEVGHSQEESNATGDWQHRQIAQVKSVPNLSLARCNQCSRPYWSMMPWKVMRHWLIVRRRRSRIVEWVEEDGFRNQMANTQHHFTSTEALCRSPNGLPSSVPQILLATMIG